MKKIIVFILFLPSIVKAEVYISEIMYDVSGTDTGREWLEIKNDTSGVVDLSTYFIFENNVSHKISGGSLLGAGEFAVVADNVEKFKEDFPNYTGKIFDSVFSLNNSGEELIVQNSLKETVNNISYNPDLGASGTGNSLQIYNGVLIPGLPTPGALNVTEPENEDVLDDTETETSSAVSGSTHSGQNELSEYTPKIKTKTGIGRDRFVTVNTPVEFEVLLSNDEEAGKYFWNFGDGNSDKGKKVENVYKHPGEYNIVMNAYFKDYKTTSRIKVFVTEPKIDIISEDQTIGIKNAGDSEINLGGFVLKIDYKKIKILQDTIISKGQTLFFDQDISTNNIVFQYPNGKDYYSTVLEKAQNYCVELESYNLSCDVEESKKLFDGI